MKHLPKRRVVAVLAAVAAAAVPAAASAHPGVATIAAKTAGAGCTYTADNTGACMGDQTHYTVNNDGWVAQFRESNGVTGVQGDGTAGMVNYKALPGSYRTGMTADQKRSFVFAQTDLQPHATCTNALLSPGSVITGWQGSDPFFNYIPWQKTSANLGDNPDAWIAVVKTTTGVDLSTLSTETDFQNACAGLPGGGVYHAADAVQTAGSSLAGENIAAVAEPLQDEVDDLTGQVGTLTTQRDDALAAKAAAESAKGTAETQRDAAAAGKAAADAAAAKAKADVAVLTALLVPLKLTVTRADAPSKVATGGVPVTVAGPALSSVNVRLLVSDAKAKQLKLTSRVLAKATVAIDTNGVATTTLKPTGKAATALKKLKGKLAVTVDATSGADRYAQRAATLGS